MKCFFLALFMAASTIASAQVTLSLSYTEKNGVTTVPAGEIYTMQMNYSVSSTTGNAMGVKIEVPMPDFVYTVNGFVGTVHAPVGNFVFDNTQGAKKLTINFVDPVASGSTGVLEFSIVSQNLTTPNNTVLTTTAEITATGGFTSGVKTHNMTLTAIPHICATKTFLSGGAVGYNSTYQIVVRTGGYANWAPNGTLMATNITLLDVLPTGATYVSATTKDANGMFVAPPTESGGVVTAVIPDLGFLGYSNSTWIAQAYTVDIVVRFEAPTFNAGDVVVNNATVNYTPITGSPSTLVDGQTVGICTSDLTESTVLAAPVVSASLTNTGCGDIFPGNNLNYDFGFNNTGNVPLENLEIVDTIPANIRIDQTGFYRGVRFDAVSFLDHTEYQTNLNSTWTTFAPSGGQVVPLLPSGEYFTLLKFVFISPFSANTALPPYNFLTYLPVAEPMAPEVVNHCMVWNSTTAGIPALAARTACNNCQILQPRPVTSKINYSVSNMPGCDVNLVIGQEITFTGSISADNGFADAENPVTGLLVPHGFQFISESFGASTSGIGTVPTLDIVPNYITISGVSKDLYRWTFPSGTVLPYGKNFTVSTVVMVTGALVPATDYTVDCIATASNASVNLPNYNYGDITDTGDFDSDGNTNELFGRANNNYCCYTCLVSAAASMESLKWVKGQCDADYSRFPNFGQTVPGGNADYQLVVKNTGNIPMKDIKIIDILPFIGDKGVIDPSPRGTEWRPNLADPIVAPPGITVYYTEVSNPCRDEVKQPGDPSPFPTGCAPANWSATPPADITKVQSVKIDFGTTILAGGDSLVFNWPMRAPVAAPTNNEIAWNSFAFVATRTDNNQALLAAEPIKVGIKVKAGTPGIYGDRVWFDTDADGVQDGNEGGVDGIKVKLFSPKVSGAQNPATDSLINFTITGNGGYYIFSNLAASDYYAVFCIPTGYSTSSPNSGGNPETDSDGTPTTYNGGPATITPTTNIGASETDLTWDQGIFCGFTPTVSPIQQVLVGGSATLTASGGTAYSWTGPNGFSATTASITINNVAAADTGTYIVNIIDGSCYASLNTGIVFGSCVHPTAITLTQTAPTCTSGTPNNDGKITLTAITNSDKFGISTGATYSGTPDYAAATAINTLPQDLQTAIPNAGGTYTIRFFNGSDGCFIDSTVTVATVVCAAICPPPPGPLALACADSVILATPCYINGDPLGGSAAGVLDAFVVWNYNNSGDAGFKRTLPASQIGSTWGTAYKEQNQTLYTSAFLKRHVGFGPSGIGAIYQIDAAQPSLAATPFVDLTTLGVNLGTDSRTPTIAPVDDANELPADPTVPSWDVDAFAAIGKKSLGGLDVSSDGNTMWTINLFTKDLLKLDISGASPTLAGTYPIANPGCSDNDYAPFAVKSFNGKTWIGITCTAETSQSASDLKAYVVAFDGTSFMPVYDFPLNYRKGFTGGVNGMEGDYWKPWTATYQNLSSDPTFTIYPTPLFSDIDFDVDGSMVLAFMDRTAHQMGYVNYLPTFNNSNLSSVHSGGDLLRVCNVSGVYGLENNGLCPGEPSRPANGDGSQNSGENNTQGPGGGEYYWGDVWSFNPYQPNGGYHQETSFGAVAFKPGSGEMVMTGVDPTASGSSAGVFKLSNTTGRKTDGFRLYANTSGYPTFGKANGLGDLELFCAPSAVCVQPTAMNMTQTAPTCVSGVAQNNGKITLTAITNADKFGISTGATYSGTPNYAAATAIGTLPQDLQTAIPNAGGTYTIRFFNGADGCFKDSTVIVSAVCCPTTSTVSGSHCSGGGFSVTVGTTVFNEANPTGTVVLDNAAGCDSTVTVNLTFLPNSTSTISGQHCAGDGFSLTVGTAVFDETNPSGSVVLVNAAGCDSTVTVNLTFLPNSTSTISGQHCAGHGFSLTVGTAVFDETNPSGSVVLVNAAGCDSTVTVNLTFLPNSTSTISGQHCAGDGFSLTVGTAVFDETNPSGSVVLVNAAGCDSTVTVNLTFLPNTTSTVSGSHCAGDGFSLTVGMTVFNEANPTGTVVLDNAAGCDSTVTVNLTFVSPAIAGTATGPAPICVASTGLATIDLYAQLTGEDAGGNWAKTSGPAVGINFDANAGTLDPNGLAAGTYVFEYTVTGDVPCPNDSETVSVTIQDCTLPCPPKVCLPIAVEKVVGTN